MFKILAWETSTAFGSVALLAEHSVLCECGFGGGITHTERLLPSIDWVLDQSRTSPEEVDLLAAGIGPGSFTGLRIGLATLKGIAWIQQLPVVGVSSLEALAANVSFTDWDICPMIDARKGEVYWSRYRMRDGALHPLSSEHVSSIPRLHDAFPGPAVFTGSGALRYRRIIEEMWGEQCRFGDDSHAYPRASRIGIIARERFSRGERHDVRSLLPHYLRRSEAELAHPEISAEAVSRKGGYLGRG